MMAPQWDYFLNNLGQWHGSFAYLSPNGKLEKEIPSIVTLTGDNENQSVRLTVEYPTELHRNVLWTFHAPETGMEMFDNGAFSRGNEGSSSPFVQLAVEQGLISGPRRLRLVHLFNVGSPVRLVLIREGLPGFEASERSPLSIEQLIGDWEGTAVAIDGNGQSQPYSTHLTVNQNGDLLQQTLRFGDRELSSSARIDGSRLYFEDTSSPNRLLLLPDGGSARAPMRLALGTPFQLELGWLLEPTLRQRLVRSYDKDGRWLNATLVTEIKVG